MNEWEDEAASLPPPLPSPPSFHLSFLLPSLCSDLPRGDGVTADHLGVAKGDGKIAFCPKQR